MGISNPSLVIYEILANIVSSQDYSFVPKCPCLRKIETPFLHFNPIFFVLHHAVDKSFVILIHMGLWLLIWPTYCLNLAFVIKLALGKESLNKIMLEFTDLLLIYCK